VTSFSLGPDFVKIHYQVGSHPHVMTLPYKINGAYEGVGAMPEVRDAEGNAQNLSVWLDEFVDKLKVMYAPTASFSSWDAFHVVDINAIPEWVFSGSFTSAVGTDTGSTVVAGEMIVTFRTALGNRYKLYLMECTQAANNVIPGADLMAAPNYGPVMAMILRNPFYTIVGRDGARIVAPIRGVSKINDVLRRKYLIA
jgi:hypothetical protein